MKNTQRFNRCTPVRLRGQPDSPPMTITKIIRTQKEGIAEMDLEFSYHCSWWDAKRNNIIHFVYAEYSLEKVKDIPKIQKEF